jgi:hypothetical protein
MCQKEKLITEVLNPAVFLITGEDFQKTPDVN